ncbi:hypothetical protein [Nocardia tenerifensis]|nr:hypothetical protein [Nocardia tenerifensis]
MRPLLFEGASARLMLPGVQELIDAFRGTRGVLPGDHLVLRWAGVLAHLHRVRHIDDTRDRVDRRRAEVVALIDDWVTTHICPEEAAVGQFADEFAEAYVSAEIGLISRDATASAIREAWDTALARAIAWERQRAQVVAGLSPIPWPVETSQTKKLRLEGRSK